MRCLKVKQHFLSKSPQNQSSINQKQDITKYTIQASVQQIVKINSEYKTSENLTHVNYLQYLYLLEHLYLQIKDKMKIRTILPILTIFFLISKVNSTDTCKRFENGKCVECIDRYTIKNGYCVDCGSHCQRCQAADWSLRGIQCFSCDLGYYVTKYQDCDNCGQHCLTCTQRYLNSPNCTLCDDQSEPYEYNGGIRCKQIVVIWPIILGFIIFLIVFFAIVIKCVLKSARKNERDSLFKLQIIQQAPMYTLKNQTLNYKLSYKTPKEDKKIDHEVTIQIYEQLTATVKFTSVTEQRVGNSVYRTYRQGQNHLEKMRKIAEQKLMIKGEELQNGYQGQINYHAKVSYWIQAQHLLEARGLMKVIVRRSDWPVHQIAEVSTNFQSHFDNRKYKFSSGTLHVDLQNATAEIKLKKAELTQDWVRQYNRYYGQMQILLLGKIANQLKITFKLQKVYNVKFGWLNPSKFKKINFKNVEYVRGGHYTQMLEKKEETLLQDNMSMKSKQLTFNLSQCQIYRETGFITSTPLMLVFWVRPTGFLSWLLSIFVTKKYQVPIMIEPQQ